MISQHQIRAIIFYESSRGSKVTVAIRNIIRIFGESTAFECTVICWVNRFESGDTSCQSGDHLNHPSSVNEDELLRGIKANPEAITCELATALRCCYSTMICHLDDLGYHRVLARWIPHRLPNSQK